ncbi:putative Gp21 [Xenorhabdus bovienii str. Jollieti]|uniref:Putative Gp21 n=1 Tax=Xenorhabdus bovienii (strain SS-2004) TaxID=406818 RepID=D3UXJ2_XENBS|nr:tape measure protein [Xenorhabdus bovienii]CBJ80367.1 putative Gp21 [Xenorhabdus bovienii SS-2004]CDH29384.1 putative Gp21 [Xenorhabdus bovienii str. Jollieti]
MADHQVGNIVYQVSMDVAQLLTAQRQVNDRLDGLERGMGRADMATRSLGKSMSSLSMVASSLISALYIQQIAKYADSWTTVNNKLVNSKKAHEELGEVTARVFDIAQRSRTSLEATATLYGRLEKATRSLNMGARDLGDMTETINKALIVSGATAAESSSVLVQLSQALAAGALRGEEFNSVSENGIRIMQAIADYLGKDIGQLKAMAAQGKLTSKIVVAAMKASADKIAKEFAKTTSTIEQAFVVANNNVTKFVGESSKVSTAANIFNKSLVNLSGNLDVFATAIGMVALAAVAKFNGALAGKVRAMHTSTQASLADARASHANALATEHAAIAANRKALADREQAILAYMVAEAELKAAAGTNAERIATDNLVIAKSRLAIVNLEVATTGKVAAVATAAVGVAAKEASVGLRLLGSAFAFVGGWFGLITIAAGVFYYMYEKTKQASDGAREYAKNLGDVKEKLKDLSVEEVAAEIDKMNKSIKQMGIDAKNAEQKIDELQKELDKFKDPKKRAIKIAYYTSNGLDSDFAEQAVTDDEKQAQEALTQAKADHVRITRELNNAKANSAKMSDIGNKKIAETNKLIYEQGKKEIPNNVKEWENAGKTYGEVVDLIKVKLSSLGIAIKSVGEDTKEVNKKMEGMIKNAERDLEIASIPDEKGKLIKEAEFEAKDAGANSGDTEKYVNLVVKKQEVDEAAEKRKKAAQEAESAAKKAQDEAESRSKQIANSLKDQREELERLNTGYEENSLEMAKYDARKAMPEGSSELQIKAAEDLAARIWLANQAKDDKIKASELDVAAHSAKLRKKEEDDLTRMYDKHLIDEKTFQEQMKAIKDKAEEEERQRKVNEAVSPAMKTLGEFDPVQNLINEHDRKIAAITDFEQRHTELKEQAEAARAAIEKKYQEDLANAQWEQWKGQNEMYQFLGDAMESLGQRSANSITGLLTGTQSANDAMRNLALTITNEAVSALVQMGMQQIKNMVIGKAVNTAAAASAVATGATITTAMAPAAAATSVATMGTAATFGLTAMAVAIPAMIALMGARKNGGPVSPNGAYRIGEDNKPEIFKANNGHQYMIPGDRGQVISNRDMGKGGSGGIVINQVNNFNVSNNGQFTAENARMLSGFVRREVYDVLANETQRDGGLLNQ